MVERIHKERRKAEPSYHRQQKLIWSVRPGSWKGHTIIPFQLRALFDGILEVEIGNTTSMKAGLCRYQKCNSQRSSLEEELICSAPWNSDGSGQDLCSKQSWGERGQRDQVTQAELAEGILHRSSSCLWEMGWFPLQCQNKGMTKCLFSLT